MSAMRNLKSLPKAHLHVHFPQAVVRRSTMEEWASKFDSSAAVKLAASEAEAARAEGAEGKALKYERRGKLLANPLSAFPPAAGPQASEDEERLLLEALDKQDPQPGAAGIWDAQWISAQLGAESNTHRVLREVYEDAVEEGVVWTELACGLKIKDGEVQSIEDWKALFEVWRELEKEFYGRTAVRFVAHCPKTAADATALVEYLKTFDECPVVGIGQWGGEVSALTLQEGYRVIVDAGIPLVCVHAGESMLQAACPAGDVMKEEIAQSYDGPKHVRDAVTVGARRIGHGIETVKDASLLEELSARGDVGLEVCLLSNRQLRCCEQGLARHPLKQLVEAKVPCCLAADDPTFFGSSSAHGLVREYIVARHMLKFDDDTLASIAKDSIKFSLAPAALKEIALDRIDRWISTHDRND
eukprot:TRINITY_DN30129_c0_g1_i1.p1 TRINITY_DN30129_c0_g1~~TRINITY_DN30129_c0_g1_i1.p1  ORF type:complete len:415 (-),score=84.34 TRINITY_DN30129_c0_g1_i1:151-1395(-)